jgi:hypothetical protein
MVERERGAGGGWANGGGQTRGSCANVSQTRTVPYRSIVVTVLRQVLLWTSGKIWFLLVIETLVEKLSGENRVK